MSSSSLAKVFEPVESLLIDDETGAKRAHEDGENPYSFLLTTSALGTVDLYAATPEVPQAFLRFHHNHDHSTGLVVKVIENEVNKLPSTNLLLRESSIGSVMLVHLIELEAHAYLRQAIKRPMKQLLRETKSFEIERMMESDEETRKANVQKLYDYSERFLKAILDSLESFPKNLRVILKGIADVVHKKFPEMPYEQVLSCTVAAIVFLRFICPSLVAYKLKGPAANANRRNLILISKVLLALASGSELQKEDWAPLKEFLKIYKEAMLKFCADLLDVETEDESSQKKKKKKKKDAKKKKGSARVNSADGSLKISKEQDLESIFHYLERNKPRIEESMDKNLKEIEKAIAAKESGKDAPTQVVPDPYLDMFIQGVTSGDLTEFAKALCLIEDRGDPNFTYKPEASSSSSSSRSREERAKNRAAKSGSTELYLHLSTGASNLLRAAEKIGVDVDAEEVGAEEKAQIRQMQADIERKERQLQEAKENPAQRSEEEDEETNAQRQERLKKEIDRLSFALEQTKVELQLKEAKANTPMRKFLRRRSPRAKGSATNSQENLKKALTSPKSSSSARSLKSSSKDKLSEKKADDEPEENSKKSAKKKQKRGKKGDDDDDANEGASDDNETKTAECCDCGGGADEENGDGAISAEEKALYRPVCDPADYETSLAWFEDERKHHKFTMLVYHKGLWCPLCRCYMKSWNDYVQPIKELGGVVFGICAQSPDVARKDGDDSQVKAFCTSDTDLSLYTYYGGEFIKPADTIKFFADAINNLGYPTKKMTVPAMISVDSEGNVLYNWHPVPTLGNFLGNRDRPHPRDVIRATVKRLNEMTYFESD